MLTPKEYIERCLIEMLKQEVFMPIINDIQFGTYRLLRTHASATDAEIRVAYLRAAKVAHPDRGGSAADMASLSGAYATVRNARARASLAAYLRAIGDPCAACNATGTVQRSRGFAAAEVSPCPACCGAAYVPRR
jgi:DnaJ-class molecular chaperone